MSGKHTGLGMVHLLLFFLLCSCSPENQKAAPSDAIQVEIAPGIFAAVTVYWDSSDPKGSKSVADHTFARSNGRLHETATLQTIYAGQQVVWKDHSRPISLREYEGKLYLISYDRVTRGLHDTYFRYYQQKGALFREIDASAYPKAVAGNNMSFAQRYFKTEAGRLDRVQIEREQDPDSIYFRGSLTAYIWNHLATGEQYEQSQKRGMIDGEVLQQYIDDNAPIRLTLIEPDGTREPRREPESRGAD